MVFSRFAWRVQPRNYLLLACHLTNATAQMVQGSRFVVRAESAQRSTVHLSPMSATPELPLHGREREAAERASKDAHRPGRFRVGLLAIEGESCASMQWQCNVNALLYYNDSNRSTRSLRLGLHAIVILCAQVDKILCISASFLHYPYFLSRSSMADSTSSRCLRWAASFSRTGRDMVRKTH